MLQCLIYKQIYRFSRNVPELPSIFLINSPPPSPTFLKSFALLFLSLLMSSSVRRLGLCTIFMDAARGVPLEHPAIAPLLKLLLLLL